MNKNNSILFNIKNIVSKETDVSFLNIKLSSELYIELGLSSLDMLNIIEEIYILYKINLHIYRDKFKTIKDIIKYLMKVKNESSI
jgi:acyl carrier protein